VADTVPQDDWHKAQRDCQAPIITYTKDVKYWSQCDTTTATTTNFAASACFAKAIPDDDPNWYIDGDKVQGSSQLRAIMQSTLENCKTWQKAGFCYNEIVVKTSALYKVPPTPSPTRPEIGDPTPGAIRAFFYLDTDSGHYPPFTPTPTNPAPPHNHNGQCDTYKRWKDFRNTYPKEKAVVLVEFDLAATTDPFTTACSDPSDCSTLETLCSSGD